MKKRILIIAAHPDDEILGCGATVAKLVQNSGVARSIILGQGMISRGADLSALKLLRNSATSANEILGIDQVRFYDFPDNSMDSVPLLEITKVVEIEIANFCPDLIFTHFGNDLNVDHRMTFQAVITACRPQPEFASPDIYSFFVPSSTDWIDGYVLKPFVPNTFIDVSDTIEKKILALKNYESEMKSSPHSRSLDSLRVFSRYWGMRVGKEYVEPFVLVRKVGNLD